MTPLESNSNASTVSFDEPTAKAYLHVDLTRRGTITGEVSGSKVDPLVRTLAKLGSNTLVSVTPAITLYASRAYLTSAQAVIVIAVQLAAIAVERTVGVRRRFRKVP